MVSSVNRILIVDDDDDFRSIISTVFKKKGWNVDIAKDGPQALRSIKDYNPDIILMGIEMPRRDGISICKIIRNDITMIRHYPVLLMASSPDKQQIVNAIDAGCDDFIIKPFKFDVMIKKVEKLVEFQQVKTIVKGKEGGVEEKEDTDYQEEEQEAEVIVYSREAVKKAFSNAMRGEVIPYSVVQDVTKKMVSILHKDKNLPLAFKMKSYNDYTYIHSINVASLCMSFAFHLKWDDNDLETLGEGGLLHDIGKTKVDIQILIKPDKLTETEFTAMKKHPEFSKDILAKQNICNDLLRIALEHHEHIDGKGYPQGLSNEQISKHARLVAVVDVYDALTTDRCYNKGVDSDEAIRIMEKETGKFDSEMLGQFKDLVLSATIGK